MTDSEVEQVVLDVVRRYTQNDSAAASSRFESDLHQGELARQRLFALLAESFTARGVSLPAHGFMLSDFLTCPTPAAVRDAIRSKVFGAPAPKAAATPTKDVAPVDAPAAAKSEPATKQTAKTGAGAKKPPAKKAPAKKAPAKKSPVAGKAARPKKKR